MELEQIMSLLAVGAFLGGVGREVTRMVFPNGTRGPWIGWRWLWHATLWAHPIMVGALIGLTGYLPSPPFLNVEGKMAVGGAVWYGLAGMFSSTAFYRLDGMVKGVTPVTRPTAKPIASDSEDE
jgi:hypothetical protein